MVINCRKKSPEKNEFEEFLEAKRELQRFWETNSQVDPSNDTVEADTPPEVGEDNAIPQADRGSLIGSEVPDGGWQPCAVTRAVRFNLPPQ